MADVFFLPVGSDPAAPIAAAGLARLVERIGLGGAVRPGGRWALKLPLGPRGRSAAVEPAWAAAAAGALAGSAGSERTVCCDTLSINLAGLDQVDSHLELAAIKGFGPGGAAPPYAVADDPRHGAPVRPEADGPSLAALTAAAAGLLVLNPVRPHPHLGFGGALFALGAGLADREGKLMLHKDIRPKVDTPLCAGCGSCLAVCLFDAIVLSGGRAIIDHARCTGCGECMNVCFMAGIAPEAAAGIPRFQQRVAAAARTALAGTAAGPRPAGYLNFLVRLDRQAGGPARRRDRLGDVGVLASRDPVALDQATWDMAAGGPLGSLPAWSGFAAVPGPLLEAAAGTGPGHRPISAGDHLNSRPGLEMRPPPVLSWSLIFTVGVDSSQQRLDASSLPRRHGHQGVPLFVASCRRATSGVQT